jgi:hypothetical protein
MPCDRCDAAASDGLRPICRSIKARPLYHRCRRCSSRRGCISSTKSPRTADIEVFANTTAMKIPDWYSTSGRCVFRGKLVEARFCRLPESVPHATRGGFLLITHLRGPRTGSPCSEPFFSSAPVTTPTSDLPATGTEKRTKSSPARLALSTRTVIPTVFTIHHLGF